MDTLLGSELARLADAGGKRQVVVADPEDRAGVQVLDVALPPVGHAGQDQSL